MAYNRYKIKKEIRDLGFRSKFEAIINEQLKEDGISYSYEGELNTVRYIVPESKHRYLSDFLLANGIIIEVKGRFMPDDRKKHLLIKSQFPDLDIRFVFTNSKSKLNKTSKTTYAMWCDRKGFKYADKRIPEAWLREKKTPEEMKKIIDLLKSFNTK